MAGEKERKKSCGVVADQSVSPRIPHDCNENEGGNCGLLSDLLYFRSNRDPSDCLDVQTVCDLSDC